LGGRNLWLICNGRVGKISDCIRLGPKSNPAIRLSRGVIGDGRQAFCPSTEHSMFIPVQSIFNSCQVPAAIWIGNLTGETILTIDNFVKGDVTAQHADSDNVEIDEFW